MGGGEGEEVSRANICNSFLPLKELCDLLVSVLGLVSCFSWDLEEAPGSIQSACPGAGRLTGGVNLSDDELEFIGRVLVLGKDGRGRKKTSFSFLY